MDRRLRDRVPPQAARRASTCSGKRARAVPVLITEETSIDYDVYGEEGPPLIKVYTLLASRLRAAGGSHGHLDESPRCSALSARRVLAQRPVAGPHNDYCAGRR
jgi:hypothetical protein